MVERSIGRISAEPSKNCKTCNSLCENMSHYELTRGFGGPVLFEGWFCSYECYMKGREGFDRNRKLKEVIEVLPPEYG